MEILHLDEAIIVVDKPAGLPVLPDGWESDSDYLVKQLREAFGSGAGEAEQRIWIVHRLDKTTSGVMVFARSAEAHRALSQQFEGHEAEKIYHAILSGVPHWDEKVAKYPLRVDVGHKHRTAVDERRGKPSETRFRVLTRFTAGTLVEAKLMTGRTHQIRAHAHAMGFPLLGDVLYGAEVSKLIGRPALHAYRLTIENPLSGQRETFSAPYADDFSQALQHLRT